VTAYWFEVPSAIVLRVTGRDSLRYLNARLTNDIRSLEVGNGCLAAALTPKGKVEGLFSVHKFGNEDFFLYCDGGDRAAVVSAFKRYIVADRVAVNDESETTSLFHLIDGFALLTQLSIPVLDHPFSHAQAGQITAVRRSRTPAIGYDFFVPRTRRSEIISLITHAAKELSVEEQRKLRIRAGQPMYGSEISDANNFSELQLKDAISYSKGCYTGQEVMEKIDSRGKAPRLMKRVVTRGTVHTLPGDIIASIDASGKQTPMGEIVSSSIDVEMNQTIAFALLRNKPLDIGEKLLVRGVDLLEM